jgi:predicted AAA+ superfamily ATPase
MYTRLLEEKLRKAKRSVLLLGPRQTGKSTLVRSLQPDLTINLADQETFVDFLRNPALLRSTIGRHRSVFIDEVQRIPSLLNTIQAILDAGARPPKFYLTGSSARRLRRGQANLLPGRVFTYDLGPLARAELGDELDLRAALSKGLLPGVYVEEDRETWTKLLRSYAATYLKEEIQAESLTRSLEGFYRFFDVVVSRSGTFIDFTKFSRQAAVERMSARRYFDVLVDTLVVHPVESFARSGRTRLVQHPRYYLFDVGVLNGALGNFTVSPDRIGLLLEHLVLQLVLSGAASRDHDIRVSTYRTEAGAEVDFILERGPDVWALEVKASRNVSAGDLRGLKSFGDFCGKRHTAMVLYLGEGEQLIDGVRVLPVAAAIAALGY